MENIHVRLQFGSDRCYADRQNAASNEVDDMANSRRLEKEGKNQYMGKWEKRGLARELEYGIEGENEKWVKEGAKQRSIVFARWISVSDFVMSGSRRLEGSHKNHPSHLPNW